MFTIDNTPVGKGYKPFIIAEISANHNCSILQAKQMILAAKQSGADAVKLQTYTPDTMTINSNKSDFLITDGLWKGLSLFELYEIAHTPYEWHKELFDFARDCRISIMSTPFDETAVDLLVDLNVAAFKIASFEITDLPLIDYVSSKGRPVFLSTGLATLDEISDAIECCYKNNNENILIFHCISSYPADVIDSSLGDIEYLSKYFDVEVGLSDHTKSNMASILAVAKGASAIEKHFKIKDDNNSPDDAFSILPSQFSSLCEDCEIAFHAVKSNKLNRTPSELGNKKFRRSLYFVNDLKRGKKIAFEDIRRIRPGYGVDPKYFDFVVGKELLVDVQRGDAVTFDVIKELDIDP